MLLPCTHVLRSCHLPFHNNVLSFCGRYGILCYTPYRAIVHATFLASQIGQLVSGVVRSVRSYAAFVELGNGVGSMLKVGELSADYVDDARAVLREGDSVTALVTRVMRTGAEQGRIELSTRHLEPSKGE